jgi:hypothetical protein
MEAPLSEPGPGEAVRAALADTPPLPGRRHIPLERAVAHDRIDRLWPPRRAQARPRGHPRPRALCGGRPRAEFREPGPLREGHARARPGEVSPPGGNPRAAICYLLFAIGYRPVLAVDVIQEDVFAAACPTVASAKEDSTWRPGTGCGVGAHGASGAKCRGRVEKTYPW